MDLIQVKKYLQERRAVTLKDVSTHFNQNGFLLIFKSYCIDFA